ncbi:hypothetical protein ACXWOC_09875 [Streptococcus pyogenes]
MSDARSGANARGLMQLVPDTAAMVARAVAARWKSDQLQCRAKPSSQRSRGPSKRGLRYSGASARNTERSATPSVPGMASGGA